MHIMKREDDYRAKAVASLHRAVRARSIADKGRLLAMAEAWLELADRAHSVAPIGYWREPALNELLSEPIILALMHADAVDPDEFEAMLRRTTKALLSRSTDSRLA
jgi:hypothetical protein